MTQKMLLLVQLNSFFLMNQLRIYLALRIPTKELKDGGHILEKTTYLS